VIGIWLALFLAHPVGDVKLTLPLTYARAPEKRVFKITFYCSCKKCCGRHSPQKGGSGLTSLGHSPIPLRTGATGDASLLGRWIFFQDLPEAVFLSDTGAVCTPIRKTRSSKGAKPKKGAAGKPSLSPYAAPCVSKDQIDIFLGGPEWHRHALRMGVFWWEGTIR